MAYEFFINVTASETRIALTEHQQLLETHVERQATRGLVGNIYRGKVLRVLPGMQAAFVDVGVGKAAFLHVRDILGSDEKSNVSQLLQPGQRIVVQVAKDALGTKGPRLTMRLALASPYIVFLPHGSCVGVSQRIEDDSERERLKTLFAYKRRFGLIIRTAAEGANADFLEQETQFLYQLWQKIQDMAQAGSGPKLLHEDLRLMLCLIRDYMSEPLHAVWIDALPEYHLLKKFLEEFAPQFSDIVHYFSQRTPIFDHFELEQSIQAALEPRVILKSGGHLVIEQTEAMTTVDVNTGAFVGYRKLEETVFNTNLEAATMIARQLRLRNLGGIIIVDFIDMNDAVHKERVLYALEQALGGDRIKTRVYGFSQLGLVEMTRKRTRESLEKALSKPCHTCHGRGYIKTPQTVFYDLIREIKRVDRDYHAEQFVVYTSPQLSTFIAESGLEDKVYLEERLGKRIEIRQENLYAPEQFDVVIV